MLRLMKTSYLIFLLSLLSYCGRPTSPSAHLSDVDSKVTITGRDGPRYVFWIGLINSDNNTVGQNRGKRVGLFRGQCPSKGSGNRDKCREGLKMVGVDSLFKVALGSPSTEAMRQFADASTAEEEIASALVLEQISSMQNDKPENQTLIKSISSKHIMSAVSKAAKAKRLHQNLKGFFALLNRLINGDVSTFDEASIKEHPDKEEREYILRIDEIFNAAAAGEGRSCAVPSQRFTSEMGGCADKQSGLIWGSVARSFGEFSDDTWFDHDSASAFCGASSVGSRGDWRLPTKEELLAISKNGFASIGLSDRLHYWTDSSERLETFEPVEGRLPDRDIFDFESDVLIGYSTFTSQYRDEKSQSRDFSQTTNVASKEKIATFTGVHDSMGRPTTLTTYTYNGGISDSRNTSEHSKQLNNYSGSSSKAVTGKMKIFWKAIERSVSGKVKLGLDKQFVVQMGTGNVFELKKFGLIGAEGELKETRLEIEDRPLKAVENSFFNSFDSYGSGSSGYSSIEDSGNLTRKGGKNDSSSKSGSGGVGSSFSYSNVTGISEQSSIVREVGRDRSFRVLSNDTHKVNPLNYVAYSLPKNVKHNTVSVICVAGGKKP